MAKRLLSALFLSLLLAAPAAAAGEAAGLSATLTSLAETPGVTGSEQRVTSWLSNRLKAFHPQVDNLGNLTVTLGSGAPHRLLVTAIDEPGYVVSGITDDGYLRVERLPRRGANPWFELLHSAQPIQILTRSGKLVPGVVAGLSTHLQPGRESPPDRRTDSLERIYIDVGAHSPRGVRDLGVDLLDPITLDKQAYALADGELTAPFLSSRFGAAVLVRLVEGMDASQLQGTLTVAFVVRHYLGRQGLGRLLTNMNPDEVVFVGPLEKSDAAPGDGMVVAALEGMSGRLATNLLRIAGHAGLPVRPEWSQPAPRQLYVGALPLPEQTAMVGVGVKFPETPIEVVSSSDLADLEFVLAGWLNVALNKPPMDVGPRLPRQAVSLQVSPPPEAGPAPTIADMLAKLSVAYGVSGHEQPVEDAVRALLPPWAREWATTDAAGNLFVPFGKHNGKPGLVFIAHMDEIGWVVTDIGEDGRLTLKQRGGYLAEYFLGHPVLVHTESGDVPAVLELPADYQTQGYQYERDRVYTAYTGAHSQAEAEALGIEQGDTVSVPKKFYRLGGMRVNARSLDDRVGDTALLAALWNLDPATIDRPVIFVFSTREEIGLEGAKHFAFRGAVEGDVPATVVAVDTFVSSDSPLESPRFADAVLGRGFVVRAVDHSNIVPRFYTDCVISRARQLGLPVQYGVTGGGNDGAAFVPYGSVDVALGWPLRYSHSSAEVADLDDIDALARIIGALAQDGVECVLTTTGGAQ